ncbi:MAG: hypothetical protein ABIN68_02180 [Sphingomicrobium sp.]
MLLEHLHLPLRPAALLEALLLLEYLPLGPTALFKALLLGLPLRASPLLEPRAAAAIAAIFGRALDALLLGSLLLGSLLLLALFAAATTRLLRRRLRLLLRGLVLIAAIATLFSLGRGGDGKRRNGGHQENPGHETILTFRVQFGLTLAKVL